LNGIKKAVAKNHGLQKQKSRGQPASAVCPRPDFKGALSGKTA
jgi:hypothetical protein